MRDKYHIESVQAKIDELTKLSQTMIVYSVSYFEFKVSNWDNVDIVDLWEKKCSCGYFEIQQLPCVHALAACKHIQLSYHSLCFNYYIIDMHVAIYAEPIHPGDDVNWVVL